MWQRYQELAQSQTNSALLEIYHDIHHGLSEAQSMYTHGVLSLAQRARVEDIYYASCRRLRGVIDPAAKHHREMLDELNEKLADKYFCNFSLFQSIPDVWAIDQIFPVMPIHRLQEQPTRRAVIEDITCDSDGRIDQYVDSEGIETSLPLHSFQRGENYLLGIFLVGAYQEILGDMHNLFGDTDSIDVELNADGSYKLSHPMRGDTVDSVLRYVQFDAAQLLEQYRKKVDTAISDAPRAKSLLEEIENGLYGYTYLEE
jgi:arginine decarboxylase